jgi:hypothetical protein
MELDLGVRRNLEITETIRTKRKRFAPVGAGPDQNADGPAPDSRLDCAPAVGSGPDSKASRRRRGTCRPADSPEVLALALRDITDLERLIGKWFMARQTEGT